MARVAEDIDRVEWPAGEPAADPEGAGDVSVGAMVRARLGDEVFERLVAPLLSGVNAGDADELSLAAGAAQLADAARLRPSLVAALRDRQQAAIDAGADPSAPVFYGIPVGTQTLTDLLLARLTSAGVPVHLGCPASSLQRSGAGWHVHTPSGVIAADRVVLATPGPVSARLLAPIVPEVAAGLGDLRYASVAMVTLAVPRTAVEHPLDASGFLVAPTDRLPTLTACSWASSKWAHLADPEVAVLRVSAGRYGDTAALDLDDDDLVAALAVDLETTMGLSAAPVAHRVTRWMDGLPQYRPGHLGRVRTWREQVGACAPTIVVAGAAFDGLGLPACIRQGRAAAHAALVAGGTGAPS
jgi:oxygen-dependent protoporphyrinogen oxidase